MSEERLLEESVLRRALRLDASEVPPRFDAVLIAPAARPSRAPRRELLVVAAIAFLGGWIWSEAIRAMAGGLLGGGAFDPLAAIISLATAALIGAAPILDVALQPAIPLAILAASALATLTERRRAHATAS